MRKRKRAFVRMTCVTALAILLLLGAYTAYAATKLPRYTCILDGKALSFNGATGYLTRASGKLTVPVEAMAKALGATYTANAKKTRFSVASDTVTVRLAKGYAIARVGNKKVRLGVKTFVSGGKVMADVKILRLLGCKYKHIKAGVTTRSAGYASGVLLMGMEGSNLTLPVIAQNPLAGVSGIDGATQVVLVEHLSGSKANMTLYQKNGLGVWTKEMSSGAYVGKNGIGKTKEGDKKTPVGTFNLTKTFGIKGNPGTDVSYLKVTKYHYWCGTSGSEYYNQLIDTRVTNRARTGADEYLIEYKGVYNYCMFIDYNAQGAAGKGSCIFLHCTGSNGYTAGCVALPEKTMVNLLKRIQSGAKIVIR